MSDDGLRLFSRLTIQPNFDGIVWTHFHIPIGEVGILQELPNPLRKRVSRFVGILIKCGVARLEISPSGFMNIRFHDEITPRETIRDPLPESVREGLRLLTWYLHYNHRRTIAQIRQSAGAEEVYTLWRCPDCAALIKPADEHCRTPTCDSWNKLYLCTGAEELSLVPALA